MIGFYGLALHLYHVLIKSYSVCMESIVQADVSLRLSIYLCLSSMLGYPHTELNVRKVNG